MSFISDLCLKSPIVAAALLTVGCIAIVSPTAFAGPALNACVNPSGIIRVLPEGISKCGTNETPVTLNQAGQSADPGTHVIDSHGNPVGRLLSNDVVLREVNGSWVTLPISQNGFKNIASISLIGQLYYALPSCAGQAYAPNQDMVAKPGIIIEGTLYFATTPPEQITVKSSLSPAGVCGSGPITFSTQASPVDQAVSISSFGLVPPFSVQ